MRSIAALYVVTRAGGARSSGSQWLPRHLDGGGRRRRFALAVMLVSILCGVGAGTARAQAPAPASPSWSVRVASASAYLARRQGRVAFALVDGAGVLHGVRLHTRFLSASVIKAMLLVAYLDRADVRVRPLADRDRSLLAAMIQRSDNDAATAVRDVVGSKGLREVAQRAGMRNLVAAPSWGSSKITAADQAHFFFRLDELVPELHRGFARHVLATIIPSQRWGIPAVASPSWRVFFKGGWRPTRGWVVNQVALLEGPGARLAIAILSDQNPSFQYGTRTVRGVASRLLTPPAGAAPSGTGGHGAA